MMLLAVVAVALCAACGSDEKDEPAVVPDGTYSSVYNDKNALHYAFDLDMEHKQCTITVYNVQFTSGGQQSPKMTIRIPNAKIASTSRTGELVIEDTDIEPEMLRGTDFAPMPGEQYKVTDLHATLNVGEKTFAITFKCHDGEFTDSGKLQ